MYHPSVQKSILHTTPNLKNVKLKKKLPPITTYYFRYSLMIRKFTVEDVFQNVREVHHRMQSLLKNKAVCRLINSSLEVLPCSFKRQSTNIFRIWAQQFECVLAQRFRRTQQMFCLYTKLWEEHALKEFLRSMRRRLSQRGKEFLLGAVGVSAYDWKANRVPDEELNKHLDDIDYIYTLKKKTIACKACENAEVDPKAPNLTLCKCPDTEKRPFESWAPYIEKDDLIVWRRTMEDGNFEYKVYGSYNDVSAIDFLNAQVDAEYRKMWDSTAIVLDVIEKDPDKDSHSDIIYWEMLWPRLFANRDYVFNRRCMINEEKNTLIMLCRDTTHPARPAFQNKHRVQAYSSVMVIKPYKDMNDPGLEFGLTYFDNPGVSIPSTVTSWVAMRAMPDFLTNLRNATKKYKAFCEEKGYTFKDGFTCTKDDAAKAKKGVKKLKKCPKKKKEPKTEPKKCKEPVEEPVTEPGTEPSTEASMEPVTEPEQEPAMEAQKDPVKEPQKEPVNEPQKEAVKEPVTEPQKEPATDLQNEECEVPSTVSLKKDTGDRRSRFKETENSVPINCEFMSETEGAASASGSVQTGKDSKGFFKYLHPLYYFT